MKVTITTIRDNTVVTTAAEGDLIECAELVKAAHILPGDEDIEPAEAMEDEITAEMTSDEVAQTPCECHCDCPSAPAEADEGNLQEQLDAILYPDKHVKDSEIEVTNEEDEAWKEIEATLKNKGARVTDIEEVKKLAAEKGMSAKEVKEALNA